ncbi:hypothetical protein HMPREF9120_00252 [Neisseria sp. oral taxon 020 str. F0370]|nr:hypothetical protein HMPREF9120_00252 [Neisseria sp. oral taxon 020 str. F0370]
MRLKRFILRPSEKAVMIDIVAGRLKQKRLPISSLFQVSAV